MKNLVLPLLISILSSQTSANDMCLIRSEPSGAPDVLQVSNFQPPKSPTILIHSEKAQACVLGTYCHVAQGDTVELVKTRTGYNATWTHRPNTPAMSRTVIEMQAKQPAGGIVMLSGRRDQTSFYLLFQGERDCQSFGDYPVGSRCRAYRFEVFPDSVSGYIKPDANPAELRDDIEWRTPCINALQPGGGDGHEIPPPRP